MLDLIALPILFVWFLFRLGYSKSLGTAALIYTFGPAALFIVVMAIQAFSTSFEFVTS